MGNRFLCLVNKMGRNLSRQFASRVGLTLLFTLFFTILALKMVPAPIIEECFEDFECGIGEVCVGGICEPGFGSSNGDPCVIDSDCSSLNCVYDINCDKSDGFCLQHCAPSTDECGRSDYFSGYDTYQTYSSWICLGYDLGGRQCTSGNTCATVGSYYCSSSNTWSSGSPPASCNCNLVSTTDVFEIKNNLGEELFRVDTDGDVAFQGAFLRDSDINEVTLSQFQIKRSGSNSEFRIIGSNKIAVYEGTAYQDQSSISLSSGGDFAIKRSSDGAIIFKIDDQGNVYARGKIASGCSCQAGTYSNPTDLAGNYVLSTTSGTSDYALGYCAQVRNCQSYTSAYTTTTSRYACRCDYTNAFGCSGSSCTTASSSWPSYSSITCA